ncbi:MAG: hypothetical protein AAF394_02565, partial [Planctomycetota bacterium]
LGGLRMGNQENDYKKGFPFPMAYFVLFAQTTGRMPIPRLNQQIASAKALTDTTNCSKEPSFEIPARPPHSGVLRIE